MRSVAVIGGGAAGLAAAVAAGARGAQVTVLEAADRVGQKILRTGNGRCNLTNMNMDPGAYNCPGFVAPVLSAYSPARVVGLFAQIGLHVVEEREGRVYPRSNTANSVLDVLRLACDAYAVDVQTGCPAVDINRRDGAFSVLASDGRLLKADAVVVATGGATELIGMCGHSLAPFKPVLTALKTETTMFRGLSGVRVHAQVSAFDTATSSVPFASEGGEVLFRDYGLSGIVVFNMSRLVEPGHVLSLDLAPELAASELERMMSLRLDALSARPADAPLPTYEMLLTGMFHPRVITCVLRSSGVRPSAAALPGQFQRIAATIKDWRTQVTGYGDPKNAQVTRGGALVEGFEPATLESRLVPGLYAAGECLNVDARCGGYNLHWAWASGTAAGHNAARKR